MVVVVTVIVILINTEELKARDTPQLYRTGELSAAQGCVDGVLVFYCHYHRAPQMWLLKTSYSSEGQKFEMSVAGLKSRYRQDCVDFGRL